MGQYGHTKNKVGVYIKDPIIEELKAMAERYDISVSRVLSDSWEIAKKCKCKVPKGVLIFADERGMMRYVK